MTSSNENTISPMKLKDLPNNIVSNSQYYCDHKNAHWIIFAATDGIYKYNVKTTKYRHIRNHHKHLQKSNLTLFINKSHRELLVIDSKLQTKVLNLRSEHWGSDSAHDIQKMWKNKCENLKQDYNLRWRLTYGFAEWKHCVIYAPNHQNIIFLQPLDGYNNSICIFSYDIPSRKLYLLRIYELEKCHRYCACAHCQRWRGPNIYQPDIRLVYCESIDRLILFHDTRAIYLDLDGFEDSLKTEWGLKGVAWTKISEKTHDSFKRSTCVMMVHEFIMILFESSGSGKIHFWDLNRNKRYKSHKLFDAYCNIRYQGQKCVYDGYTVNEYGIKSIHFMVKSSHFVIPIIDIMPDKLIRKYCMMQDPLIYGYMRENSQELSLHIPHELALIVKDYVPLFA